MSDGGYVYVVLGDGGLVKIGRTTNPPQRLRQLAAEGAIKESAWVSERVGADRLVEAQALAHFAPYRVRGEWFSCEYAAAVEVVKLLASRQIPRRDEKDTVRAMSVRIREDLIEWLKESARQNGRSMNGEMLAVIKASMPNA